MRRACITSGLIAFKRNAGPQAVDYIRQSVAIDPNYHEAWLNLAIILGDMHRADEAIEACKQCVALQPENSKHYEVLGNLLRLAESNAAAMAAYVSSLRLNPDQPLVLARLGNLLLQDGNAAEALSHCRRALEIDPSFSEARSLERRILASSGHLASVEAALDAQSANPEELAKKPRRAGQLSARTAPIRGCRRLLQACDCRGAQTYRLDLSLSAGS